MERKARIVATIGPSSQDESTLAELVRQGLDVARLNFSHGSHQDHADRIQTLRSLSSRLNRPITILQDLQGPKLRVGTLPGEGIRLNAGQLVYLAQFSEIPDELNNVGAEMVFIPMDVPDLINSVSPGKRILLDDGNLELEVEAVFPDSLKAKVVLGGLLKSNKGVNLPGANLDIPFFTEKDDQDLKFGLQHGVDVVAISFVRTAEDITFVRNRIAQIAPDRANTPIIAKLELPEAISNLHEIIHASDGVMVARGDLGVETSPSHVPIIQKQIIQLANHHMKIVITATQMLDSMIHNPRPTRAEASDVANAIFDGTDAVMLSGETASGDFPIESIKMMDSIVREAERHYDDWGNWHMMPKEPSNDDAVSMTRAASELADDTNVAAIAVFSLSGKTALLMSKMRPRVPVIALTPEISSFQRMGMYWGVTPYIVAFAKSVEGMIKIVEDALLSCTSIEKGQQVIIISSVPIGSYRPPNFVMLHTVGEEVSST